ncbi:uroporphyrinogen-III synthase [Halocynthiibacter sp. C4]|uniref:uroporphyrinogen-III synthase n=1 Tax=Halocynthiibacter sp. C4 TaxID=2992758 RepID=UPI00237A89D2|nr:uroporphyrinogen-III synthase [Halocynthiibacter sp. C4]MDE0591036.1 uroporphyrinogen-III synthase [Halocynthiibacter sp. C4]
MPNTAPAVLLTRPFEAAQRFACAISKHAPIDTVISPLIRIEKLDVDPEFEAVILTSENGIPTKVNARGRGAYCVGERTAEAAQSTGFQVNLIANCAYDLVEALLKSPPNITLVHLRGEHARGEIAKKLAEAGLKCEEVVTYRQLAESLSSEALDLFRSDRKIILPLFSPRSAILANRQINDIPIERLNCRFQTVALSDAVAKNLSGVLAQNVTVADAPNGHAMQQIVARLLR